MAQVVCNQITERQSAMLLAEMQRHVMPLIAGKLDTIKAQIQADVSHKLSACDQLLRDTIVKVCSHKVSCLGISYRNLKMILVTGFF